MTNDLARRVHEHRTGAVPGFSERHDAACNRPRKVIKHWSRAWKIQLIEAMNPDWHDLDETLNK